MSEKTERTDRYMVISSDCHAGLPPERYREYVDPEYREIFDVALPIQIEATKAAAKKFLVADINEEWRQGLEKALTGAGFADVDVELTPVAAARKPFRILIASGVMP